MFCINNLNENIIAQILGYVVSDPIDYLYEWKSKLQYLHVCSMWSDILTPSVMSFGFISLYKRTTDNSCTPDSRPTFYCFSNTEIIIGRGYQSITSDLLIMSSVSMSFQEFFDVVFNQLKPESYEWSSIASLRIHMASIDTVVVDEHNFVAPPDSEGVYQECTETIYRCMPNVKKISSKEPNEGIGSFTHLLINRYAHRLVYIDSPNPISLSQNQLCKNLTHLKLKFDPDCKCYYLPYLQAAPLEYLDLSNIPLEFSWAEFYDSDKHDIVFKNLQTLCLYFKDRPLAHQANKSDSSNGITLEQPRFVYYRLHFPKLITLRINNCPFPSELLFCQKYFNTLYNVYVGGIMNSVARAIDMGLKRQEGLKVHIWEILPDQHDMFCNTTNYLFGGGNHSNSSQLVIGANLNTVDISSICWPHLVRLFICVPINVEKFFNLISILPNLNSAIANCLYIQTDTLGLDCLETLCLDTDNLYDYRKALDVLFCMFPTGSTSIKEMGLYFDKNSPGAVAIKACISISLALSSLSINKLSVEPRFRIIFDIIRNEIQHKLLPQSRVCVDYQEEEMFIAKFWHMFYML